MTETEFIAHSEALFTHINTAAVSNPDLVSEAAATTSPSATGNGSPPAMGANFLPC